MIQNIQSMFKMKKIILFLLFGVFLISLVGATQESLGTYKQNTCVELIQTCGNCTYNNISTVKFPNSSTALLNVAMTRDDTYYNYTFCNTSTLGTYIVNGFGDLDGEKIVWSYGFVITYTGKELSSASSTFYIVLFGVFIFLFLITIFGIDKLPGSNATDEEGTIIKISYLKYFRSVLWFVAWMFIVAILYISSSIGLAYLEDTLFANFLFTLFRISFGLTLPIVVIWFVWIFAKIFDDKKIKALWGRGMFNSKI